MVLKIFQLIFYLCLHCNILTPSPSDSSPRFVKCSGVASCLAVRYDAPSGRHIKKFSVLKIAIMSSICVKIRAGFELLG